MSTAPRDLPPLRASRPVPIPDRDTIPGQPVPVPSPDPEVVPALTAAPTDEEDAAREASVTKAAGIADALAREQLSRPVADPESVEAARAAQILAEQAEAARVRSLGPPPVGLTAEQLAHNPSDFHPEDHPEVDEGAINLGADQIANKLAERNASVLASEAKPAVAPEPVDVDTRQLWVCVQADGLRTDHQAFHSDAHLLEVMVHCPECNSTRVRKVEPGEVLAAGR